MKVILAIGAGSFIGGILRYLLSQFIQARVTQPFPFGTFGVNIIGCFLIGVVFALAERGDVSHQWRLFFATGLLGGFTTFSAFSYETLSLFRDGQLLYAGGYIVLSVFLGLTSTFAGISVVRYL